MTVQIETDGVTTWVNTAVGCIGRFGRWGIDIHRHPIGQALGGECLLCTHELTTLVDWRRFVEGMKSFHGVHVDDSFMPTRFRKPHAVRSGSSA